MAIRNVDAVATVQSGSAWLEGREAARLLDVPGPRNVAKLAARGLITKRDLPGVRARYSRADVERLAAEPVSVKVHAGAAKISA